MGRLFIEFLYDVPIIRINYKRNLSIKKYLKNIDLFESRMKHLNISNTENFVNENLYFMHFHRLIFHTNKKIFHQLFIDFQ